MISIWPGLILTALALGFGVTHFRSQRTRRICLGALFAAPPVIFTVVLAFAPPAPPGFWEWWGAGMVMISPLILVWTILSATAFIVGRSILR